MKIGILSPARIAYNRFLPALSKIKNLNFAGVAIATKEEREGLYYNFDFEKSKERAMEIVNKFGGKVYYSFKELLSDESTNCVYVPLPPSLHYRWGKAVLDNNKHLLMEKPFSINIKDTIELIHCARNKKLVVFENYMFQYHNQINELIKEIRKGIVGDLRRINICFGFPLRNNGNDFRYIKSMGGGAIYDCAGYTFKLANLILGEMKLLDCKLISDNRFDVDIHGAATFINKNNLIAHVSFGMDCDYKCSLEVWGSRGTLYTDRVFTAPSDYLPSMTISSNNIINKIELPMDDSFYKSILQFSECVHNEQKRQLIYNDITNQAKLIDEAIELNEK